MAGIGSQIATRYQDLRWRTSPTRNARRLLVRARAHVLEGTAALLSVPEVFRDEPWRIDLVGLLLADLSLCRAQWECDEDLL